MSDFSPEVHDLHKVILNFVARRQKVHQSRKKRSGRYYGNYHKLILFENDLFGEVFLTIDKWPNLHLQCSKTKYGDPKYDF